MTENMEEAPDTAATLELEIAADLSEVTRCGAALADLAEKTGLDEASLFKIDLAVDEMLTNVIKYAFDDKARFQACLSVWVTKERVILTLVDSGRPFDPFHDAKRPDTGLALEDRQIGGLGIHFVRDMMDETAYRREDGYNKLTLVKYRDKDKNTEATEG